VLPDRITIYRRAICAVCSTEADVAVQVRRTVVHEVATTSASAMTGSVELGW